MYHEEQIINGVLHFRTKPEGDWTPYSATDLTIMLQGERMLLKAYKEFIATVRSERATAMELARVDENDPDDLKDIRFS